MVLTTGEWCHPVNKMSHHMKKGVERGLSRRGLRKMAAF